MNNPCALHDWETLCEVSYFRLTQVIKHPCPLFLSALDVMPEILRRPARITPTEKTYHVKESR
jgi:hypothetical protein